MLLLTLATLMTGYGVWSLVQAIGFQDRLLRAIAFAAALPVQIALLVLVLGGPLRTLRPGALAAAAIVLAAAEVALTRRSSPVTGDASGLGPTPATASIEGPGARDLRARWAGQPGRLVADLMVGALGAVVAFQYLWQAIRTIILPTQGWDALSYHLISPSIWVQRGSVGRTGVSVLSDGYPQGQELVHAWTMTFLHSLQGTGIVVIWFAGLGGLCVAWLARALGASARWGTVSALLFLGMPAAFLQVSANYVDLAGASTALATLILCFVRPRADAEPGGPRRWAVLVLLGAVLGLAVAIKASNLVLVPLVLLLVAADGALFVRDGSRPAGTDFRPARELLLLGVPLLAVGSWWYLRNLMVHDNPFYPVTTLGFQGAGAGKSFMLGNDVPREVAEAPFGLLGGVVRSWTEDLTVHRFVYDQRLGGFGAVWLLACLPALAFVAWRSRPSHRSVLLAVGLPALVVALASQTAWWARFSLAFTAIGCTAVGPALQRLGTARPRWQPLALGAVVALAVITSYLATFPQDISTGADRWVASPRALWNLASEPGGADRISPYNAYPGRHEIPAGATVALLARDTQQFPQIVVGDDLERRLAVLDQPSDEGELTRQLREHEADFVLVPPSATPGDLGSQLGAAPDRYRPAISPVDYNGTQVWEFGTFERCDPPEIKIAVFGSAPLGVLAGTVGNDCGLGSSMVLEIWAAQPEGDPWSGPRLLSLASPDEAGGFRADLPEGAKRGDRYFARFSGAWSDRRYVPPAASSPAADNG